MVVDNVLADVWTWVRLPPAPYLKMEDYSRRLRAVARKRSRRVKACVGSNPMSSWLIYKAPIGVFVGLKVGIFADLVAKSGGLPV